MKKIIIAFTLACVFCLVLGSAALAAPPETITINPGEGAPNFGEPEEAPPEFIIVYPPRTGGGFVAVHPTEAPGK